MVRHERIQFPGASYHIMSRGNAGADIFLDDEDRRMFLDLLRQTAMQANWRVHAWCLMSNHFHLFLTTLQPNLSPSMQRFNGTFCQRFNRRHSRQGHVFQGRYKALLVGSDAYALQVSRYILRNPVEAKIARSALAYPWCSAKALVKEERQPWMDFSLLDAQLAGTHDRAAGLRAFLAKDQRLPVASAGLVYGEKEDIEELSAKVELPQDLVRRPMEDFAQEETVAWRAMARAVEEGKHRGADVARYFGKHRSTVTKAVARYRTERSAN